MGRELLEFGVCSTDVAELSGSEFGKIGLRQVSGQPSHMTTYSSSQTYIDVEFEDWILLSTSF